MHAQTFVSEWNTLLKPEAYRTEIDMDGERTGVVRTFLQSPLKNDLALELGEFFYQLRAALDGAIYKMTVVEGGGSDPPADENRIEFPVYPTKRKFDSSACNQGPLPSDLKKWLESIQPYNASKTVDAKTAEFVRVLKLIHDCARKDRHRKLHAVAAIPTDTTFKFDIAPPGVLSFAQPIPANFMNNESIFLRFAVKGPAITRQDQIKLTSNVTIEVAIQEIPHATGPALGQELNRMVAAISALINVFEDGYK